MTDFSGQSEHKLDAKGRLFVPRRLFDEIPDPQERSRLNVFRGQKNCLLIFTQSGFEKYMDSVLQSCKTNRQREESLGALSARRTKQEVDSQGRIQLPKSYMEKVGIQKEVVVVGAVDRIEIWDLEAWQEKEDYFERVLDEVLDAHADSPYKDNGGGS